MKRYLYPADRTEDVLPELDLLQPQTAPPPLLLCDIFHPVWANHNLRLTPRGIIFIAVVVLHKLIVVFLYRFVKLRNDFPDLDVVVHGFLQHDSLLVVAPEMQALDDGVDVGNYQRKGLRGDKLLDSDHLELFQRVQLIILLDDVLAEDDGIRP